MAKVRTCSICGTRTDTYCPTCLAAFPQRRDVTTMTAEERGVELERWLGPLEIPMEMLHQRIEELVGRPVWTHELAQPEQLIAEIRRGQPAGMGEVVAKLPADKTIIVTTD